MIYIVDTHTHTHTQCTSSDKLIRPADFNAGHLSLCFIGDDAKKCVPLWETIAIIVKKEESPNQIFIFFYSEKKNRNYDSTSNSAKFTRELGQLFANGSR